MSTRGDVLFVSLVWLVVGLSLGALIVTKEEERLFEERIEVLHAELDSIDAALERLHEGLVVLDATLGRCR